MAKLPKRKSKATGDADKLAAPKIGKWPADQVECRPITELLAYPQNPMMHDAAQIDAIVASMREWGWTIPILVDEKGVIIAGHGRLQAAQKLGLAEVPVMTAKGWTEAQKKSYRIADNAIPRHAGATWHPEMLKIELAALKVADFPVALLGFEPIALEAPAINEPSPPVGPKKKGTIFVSVPAKRMGAARSVISKALSAAGIDHNL